jgi:diaminopimelate decarboxylase
MNFDGYPLNQIAAQVGTPFYLLDAGILRANLARLQSLTADLPVVSRYAMKANSVKNVLELVREAGLWIDAVSGNEVLRAMRAGFPGGLTPPRIMLTADVFRDNALEVLRKHEILPNLGSPGMIRQLAATGYRGPVAVRANPGFGHGHVQACDTGGPSSKHGVWHEDLEDLRQAAAQAGLHIEALHAHIGTGPQPREFDQNMRKLVDFFESILPAFPDVSAVNFGGGIPHPYRPHEQPYDLAWYRPVLEDAVTRFARAAGRQIRVEIEPGRYPVAGIAALVCRVHDVKQTRTNPKGPGHNFIMVDAGFCDLIRPAMYGSYHHISVIGAGAQRAPEPMVVAGPLCESGDVFTRDGAESIVPRMLPRPEPGDLLVLHDAGAYGSAMSSNYVSMGRAAQVLWDGGRATLVARRETLEDVVHAECAEPLSTVKAAASKS